MQFVEFHRKKRKMKNNGFQKKRKTKNKGFRRKSEMNYLEMKKNEFRPKKKMSKMV